ncbi:IS701 family transposase [Streptomyces sp.]|uniref:IS701 family transposase n=1 Tax=Streptomyces sp. TaxID=1931 RepID=UPI0025E583FB|nr:IS701 family transposase [Streptomyces sp.]
MATPRLPVAAAPGPLEGYLAEFDPVLASRAQRAAIRDYVAALLRPSERNKTLTALAETEPGVGSKHPEEQRLQWFLSESPWDHEKVNDRRIELLVADARTAPHEAGVLIIDDSGDRKSGHATDYVARQYLGSRGKTEEGIVAVTTCWADDKLYWPVHTVPYQPASRLPGGRKDPAFQTKPQIAAGLVTRARAAGIGFRCVVADADYGPSHAPALMTQLDATEVPYVVALIPAMALRTGSGAPVSPRDAAAAVPFTSPTHPGRWHRITRHLRDGSTQTWWATEITLGAFGPNKAKRMVVATVDPKTLPKTSTRYLATNIPRRARRGPWPPATMAEVVGLYSLRNWIEQDYKQVKHELGWADFQVRSGTAICRHWTLVNLAFSFGWQQDIDTGPASGRPTTAAPADPGPDTWPQRLRRIRAWLVPFHDLLRIIRSGALAHVPREINRLTTSLASGHGINLYQPP